MNHICLTLFACLLFSNIIVAQSSTPSDKEIIIASQFQAGRKYTLRHIKEFTFDSLNSFKSGFALGPSHPAINGGPISGHVEKRDLIIQIPDYKESHKAIISYDMAEMESNYAVYDSLAAILKKSDSLQIAKQKNERSKKIRKWN